MWNIWLHHQLNISSIQFFNISIWVLDNLYQWLYCTMGFKGSLNTLCGMSFFIITGSISIRRTNKHARTHRPTHGRTRSAPIA